VGGADVFAAYVNRLKTQNPFYAVVSAGDLIGASPLVSALFHDGAQFGLLFSHRHFGAELGSIQFEARNDERIPIPGGDSGAGMWSVITAQFQQDQGAYSPITHGNSYIQVIGCICHFMRRIFWLIRIC
jgi:hypothetical protein